jgi:ribulose-phosphate 3-epimerase
MVENPLDYIDDFLDANFITFHVEAVNEDIARKIIKNLHEKNIKVGMSIKPKTKIGEIQKYLEDIDMVLVMTVEPGFGGQALIPDTIKKVEALRKMNSKIDIEVDGGINLETAQAVKDAGANILVPGSAIFNSKDKKFIVDVMKK